MEFTEKESMVLNRIQTHFVFNKRPFKIIADELEITESEVISIVKKFREDGLIRDTSAIFNASSMGYDSALVAFKVKPKNVKKTAEFINTHPGISHNYLRKHSYNIWFTLSVLPNVSLEKTVEVIAKKTGAIDSVILRNEKLLKIGLMLNVGGKKNKKASKQIIKVAKAKPFTEVELEVIRLLQVDLPITEEPFDEIIKAEKSSITVDEFVEIGNRLFENGVMRRYSSVLRHRKAGYKVNGMSVWKMNENLDSRSIEEIFKDEQAISHLYLRTVYPGRWEYPLFAMIHAHSDEELNEIVETLAKKSGLSEYSVLTTLEEFKKTRVKYYTKDFDEWNLREMV